ncbi:bifunctional 5,10-methylenetetrahydrofolate dehydrogenase/5,10-methenyltetrahydrofolate cyclohydrolase [bacterium]|nr:bifunctional 5,10-methylenetetrahydrofolate dehydrogenase/5,10-methenyltetrahydrofolate cyclohydrolase [bacterium]
MESRIIDGEAVAAEIKNELKGEVMALKKAEKAVCLAAVQAGENPSSRVYIKNQKMTCEELGIDYMLHELSGQTTQDELIDYIEKLNNDKNVTGIILQMPLPEAINPKAVQWKIAPEKDVEGMHPANFGRLFYGQAIVSPCTAKAAVTLLKSTGVSLKGLEVVMVGHSEIVGKPVAIMLLDSLRESPTVTVCHIATKDLAFHTRRADVVIVAAGKPGLIRADMVKEGVILIDIGINRVPVLDEKGQPVLDEKGKPRKKTVGDADFDAIRPKASYITPVPGGVGPVTVAMLLKNTVEAAKASR